MIKLANIGIVVKKEDNTSPIKIQKLLSSYSSIILGRFGISDNDTPFNIITLILKGKENDILSLKNKLEKISSLNIHFYIIDY